MLGLIVIVTGSAGHNLSSYSEKRIVPTSASAEQNVRWIMVMGLEINWAPAVSQLGVQCLDKLPSDRLAHLRSTERPRTSLLWATHNSKIAVSVKKNIWSYFYLVL